MCDKNSIRIHYFNARGRAELIRLILVEAEVEFEETKIPLAEWSDYDKGKLSKKCLLIL